MIGKKQHMFVTKRDGREEEVHFDKITGRIEKLAYGLDMDLIDPAGITFKIIDGLCPGVKTTELDTLAADIAATSTVAHADYGILAARLAVSNLHKETKSSFSEVMIDLYNAKDQQTNEHCPLISKHHIDIIQKHQKALDEAIVYDRDFDFNYFAFRMLEKIYLKKLNGKVVERPQQMLMRVSLNIYGEDIDKVVECYDQMSQQYFIHSSQTLMSACSFNYNHLSTSYILPMTEDDIGGIYDKLKQCAVISKCSGDVGISIHCIRAKLSPVQGTNGFSNGLVPMLRVFNNVTLFVQKGRTEQPGNYTIYLEPWHIDVLDVLEMKKPSGKEEYRARDLSYGLWIPDLFMKRVKNDEMWSLMCPDQSPDLFQCWGDEFESLYIKYENEKIYRKQIKARDIWSMILNSQLETGMPFMLYKDHCNRKSNQKHLGTIQTSSSSTDIIHYADLNEIFASNLATISLDKFVDSDTFNFNKLKEITKLVTRNLDKMIDINNYPLEEAKLSSIKHRSIGISVQGLADAFIMLKYPFESDKAQKLNVQIFETIYYGALEASCELAQQFGTHETYKDSPISQGILQYDLWNVKPTDLWDWSDLKDKIRQYGVRNSLLVAINTQPPSSAISTAPILGTNESIEPYSTYVQSKRVLATDLKIINRHLLYDLVKLGIWNDDLHNKIIENNGSVQNIKEIPDDIKSVYKTVWEIPQKTILQMAADRGAFIDQSQSLNVYLSDSTASKLTSMHFYAWDLGLKTGMFYLYAKAPNPQLTISTLNSSSISTQTNSAVSNEEAENVEKEEEENGVLACSLKNGDDCMACSA